MNVDPDAVKAGQRTAPGGRPGPEGGPLEGRAGGGGRFQGWPNRCAICRSDTQGRRARICSECKARFASPESRCRLCALPLASPTGTCGRCLREPPPWSLAVAACDYGYPWDGLITAFKFGDAIDLAGSLADLLADRVAAMSPRCPVDALLPMPLSDARLRERGYNQAALLARRLGRRLSVPVQEGWLLRTAERERQTALPREQRLSNLRGAFAVEPLALDALRGRQLALVDDVMTTGATLAEATRALAAAGAARVEVWVVGRTPG